jgi:hypothetical protein
LKQITNKEYEEFLKYKEDKLYGRLLTSDGLRLCKFRFIGSPIPLATDQCFRS